MQLFSQILNIILRKGTNLSEHNSRRILHFERYLQVNETPDLNLSGTLS